MNPRFKPALYFLPALLFVGHIYSQNPEDEGSSLPAKKDASRLFSSRSIGDAAENDAGNTAQFRFSVAAEEIAVGTVAGVILAVPGALITARIAKPKDGLHAVGLALLGAYTGYVLGNSSGIWFVAKKYRRNPSFLGTLGSGVLGATAGTAIFYAVDQKGVLSAAPLILPTVFSIFYVHQFDGVPSGPAPLTLNYGNLRYGRNEYSALNLTVRF